MKTLKNTRRTLIVALSLIFTLAVANDVKAGTENDITPVAFKCIGKTNNVPVFQLSFSNEQVETFAITIKNNNNIIFFEKLKGNNQTLLRKYQFINENTGTVDNEDEVITIEVRNVATNKVVSYTFNIAEVSAKGYDLIASK